jgi:DNA mismatch endonuclease, patch repair protein
MDTVDTETRSRMMRGIRGKDTKPELAVRKLLHASGFRFRLHDVKLPGKPDIVLSRHKLCIFVHGCFWHRHNGCKYTTFPKSRVDFWKKKFDETVVRDAKNISSLLGNGWRVLELWECGIKHRKYELEQLLKDFPKSHSAYLSWPQKTMIPT